MVTYAEDSVFPAPRERVWKLLDAHREDRTIPRIHPLVLAQRTLSEHGAESVVERTIDARGKHLVSRWKLTYRPPDYSRWDVVESAGPWEVGSFVENQYDEAAGGTRIRTHGELRITVLPFFLPQGLTIRRVLGTVDAEDQAYLKAQKVPPIGPAP